MIKEKKLFFKLLPDFAVPRIKTCKLIFLWKLRISFLWRWNDKNEIVSQVTRDRQLCGILVDFAIQLMTLLEQINRDSFQRFQLRAGLNQVIYNWKVERFWDHKLMSNFMWRDVSLLELSVPRSRNTTSGETLSMLQVGWNPLVSWGESRFD